MHEYFYANQKTDRACRQKESTFTEDKFWLFLQTNLCCMHTPDDF